MRMFIGLALPRNAGKSIARVMDSYGGALGRGIVPPENLHITLDFLGEVDGHRTGDIKEMMLKAIEGLPPVPVSTGATGWFGGGLLYIGITQGAQELSQIKQWLDAGLAAIGVNFDEKPFRPHITLARRVDKQVALEIPPLSFHVGEITLFKSERVRQGQVYTSMAQASFAEGRLRIDRLEGKYAVCENTGGGMVDIELSRLPFQVVEGMLINKDGAEFKLIEQTAIKRLSTRHNGNLHRTS